MPSFSKFVDRLVDFANAVLQFGVVRVRNMQELDALLAEFADGVQDVVGGKRDVLHAGAAVELEILFDLRFLLCLRRAR